MNNAILVTGGAQGIGRAVTELFLKDHGRRVVVIDKQKTAFISEMEAEFGDRFSFYLLDIADGEGLSRVLAELQSYLFDGIVNNAGEVYFEKWDDLSLEIWDRTFAVNVRAPLQIVHALRDSLSSAASIVNIASVDGTVAAFETVAYAASKAALMNVTKSFAAILGPRGVRTNAIAPGWVQTEMTKDTLPTEASWMTPLGRNATAQDVAELVAFLLSPNAGFINGETITIDGGLTVVDYTLKLESEKLHNPTQSREF